MVLLRARQIRSPASAPRAQSVAKRAVHAKLKFAQLRRLRIAGKWILVLRAENDRRCPARNQHATRVQKK